MTLDALLVTARLREVRALERVRAAIVSNASDGAWMYCLSAIDARVRELGELLRRDDPELVTTSLQMLDDERNTVGTVDVSGRPECLKTSLRKLPSASRIH